jgi:hypothetical protein
MPAFRPCSTVVYWLAWRAAAGGPSNSTSQSLQAPPGYQAGAVVCIQTFAENLRWNPPHVYVLLLSGMVNQGGKFLALSHWDLAVLTEIFRREILRLLQSTC